MDVFWQGFEKAALFGWGKKKDQSGKTPAFRSDRSIAPYPEDGGDDLDWVQHILHLEKQHGIDIPDNVAEAYRKKQISFDHDRGIFNYHGQGRANV